MRQQKTERTANRFIDTLLVLTLFLWLAPHPVKAEKFVFTTAWTAQAQFAGYYIAKEKGFYKQAGLEPESDGIGRHDTDSYTGGSLTTASPYAVMWNARHDYGKVIDFEIASALCTMYNISIEEPFIKDRTDEDIVVPVSACGEYTQMYMN